MNATSTFRPRASSPSWVDELSAIAVPSAIRSPTSTIGRWLMHVPWLLRTNFWSLYSSSSPASVSIRIRSAVTLVTTPPRRATTTCPESRGALLHAGADDRRLRLEERDGLALHVRAHEGAVRVVVLEERDQRRGDRDDLLGADVHVLDRARPRLGEGVAVARRNPLGEEVALGVERRVRLGDDVLLLLVGREVLDVGGHDRADRGGGRLLLLELGDRLGRERLAGLEDGLTALGQAVAAGLERGDVRVVPADRPLDLAVGRLDEAVAVDPAVGRERSDQADVRPFRRLDRADPAVVAVVDVADVEPGALARQAARPQRRQPALRGELGQRVRLVHELGKLAAAEELLHRSHDRPDVDERVRGRLVDLLDGHSLAHDPLHAQQADPERVLDQLA